MQDLKALKEEIHDHKHTELDSRNVVLASNLESIDKVNFPLKRT
jgi:hypothetical protein